MRQPLAWADQPDGQCRTALGSGADQMTSGYEDEEANKKAQRDAMLMTLMGLRR